MADVKLKAYLKEASNEAAEVAAAYESFNSPPDRMQNQNDILLVIDMQNDFATPPPTQGAFYVGEGEHTIAPIKEQIKVWPGPVYATVDYHPSGHCSFATAEEAKVILKLPPHFLLSPSFRNKLDTPACSGPFPPHCVIGGNGAQLIPKIRAALNERGPAKETKVFHKGFHKDKDSFGGVHYKCSAFGKSCNRVGDNKVACADLELKTKTGAFNLNTEDDRKFDKNGFANAPKNVESTWYVNEAKKPPVGTGAIASMPRR